MGKHAATAATGAGTRRSRHPGVLVAALVVIGVAVGTTFIVTTRSSHPDSAAPPPAAPVCPHGTVRPVIGVDPSAASWIGDLATEYARRHPTVDRRCVAPTVETLSVSSAGEVLRAAPFPGGGTPPAAWIPDSSIGLASLRAVPDNAEVLPAAGASIASSPLVLAAPESTTTAIKRALGPTPTFTQFLTWAQHPAGRPMSIAVANPATSTAGLGPVLATAAAGAQTRVAALPAAAFTSASSRLAVVGMQHLIRTVGSSSADILARSAAATSPATLLSKVGLPVVSERELIRYDAGHPAVPLHPVYAFDGALSLDYPYVPVKAAWVEPRDAAAAAAFGRWLTQPATQAELSRYGMRRADGALGSVADATTVELSQAALPPPSRGVDGRTAIAARAAWNLLTVQRSVLTLIDVSGSMGSPIPGLNETKLQLVQQTGLTTLPYFLPDDHLGTWEFSTDIDGKKGQEYRQLVSLGPADSGYGPGTRRQAIARAFQALTPQHGTALYDSVLAAYRAAQARYLSGAVNVIILLTDGKNEDDPKSVGLGGLLTRLRAGQDSGRPVRIITIGYGADADRSVLRQIALATGGLALDAPNPQDITSVFAAALSIAE